MAIYRKKKFTSPKKWAGRGPPGPIGSAANDVSGVDRIQKLNNAKKKP